MRSLVVFFVFLFNFMVSAQAQDLDGLEFRLPTEQDEAYGYSAVEWMMPVQSALGSQGLANFIGTYHRVENPAGETFSQICNYINTGIASSSEYFLISLVDPLTGRGTDKLWTSATVSTIASGQKCASFSDVGSTWTTVGLTYQDANGNLVLPYGTTIWKSRIKTNLNSERYISNPRQLGGGIDPANILTTTWNGSRVYFAGDVATGFEVYDGRVPYMPLVLVAPAQ